MREETGPANIEAWSARRDQLAELTQWKLEARAGLKVAQDGYNGTLSWEQIVEDIDFRVRGPFGIGGLRIHGGPQKLRVKTSKGEVFFLLDPIPDMESHLGWSIPLRSMPYWLRGLPDPTAVAEEHVDERGLLRGLQQIGWQVSYDQYRDYGDHELPRKLTLAGDEVRIKLVVDRWILTGGVPEVDQFPDL